MKILPIGTTSLLLFLTTTAAFAAGMRCGSRLVEIGDTEYEVARKCGQPSYKEGNRWIYDRGTGRFLKILKFGNGKLLFIDETQSDR